MSNHPYQYPEDLTGTSSRNKVQNEDHEIPTRYERIFVPAGGPFYSHSMRIIDTDTGKELAPVSQFKCLHLQNEATLDSGQQVCCIVVIVDDDVDHIRISYQVVGGKYGEVVTTLREIVDDIDWDKITRISWGSNVYGKPELYPAAPHRHNADDFTGWERVVAAMQSIYHALIIKDNAVWESVYSYMHRQIKLVFDSLGYTKETLDNEFADVRANLGKTQIRSNLAKNLITLRPDGVYFNDNYRIVDVTNNYTAKLADIGSRTIIRLTTTPTRTITIPKVGGSVVVGSTIHIRRMSGGTLVTGASDVAIVPSVNNRVSLEVEGSTLTLVYAGSDLWDAVIGGFSEKPVAPPAPGVVDQLRKDLDDVTGKYSKLSSDLAQLLARPAPKSSEIPVGGIFETTVHYASSAAVAAVLGYGRWRRYSEGRVRAGYTTSTAYPAHYRKMAGIFGSDTHTLDVSEMPPHTHDLSIGSSGSSASIDNGTASGSRLTTSSTGGGKPHENRQPTVVVGVWERIPDTGTPPPIPTVPPIDVTNPVSELTLTMSEVTTHLGSGSARFESYSTAKSTQVKATGFKFPTIPLGSITNFSTADYFNAGGNYPSNHWKSKVQSSLKWAEPYMSFSIPLPSEYNESKHRIEFSGSVTKHQVVGKVLTVRLLNTYRVIKSGSVTVRGWDTNAQTFTVKIFNKG